MTSEIRVNNISASQNINKYTPQSERNKEIKQHNKEASEGVANQHNAEMLDQDVNQIRDEGQVTAEQIEKMEQYVQNIHRDLEFSVDDETGEVVVKVFNSATSELIRQIPAEEILKMQELIQSGKGGLFNAKV